jgi:hypothetical protein
MNRDPLPPPPSALRNVAVGTVVLALTLTISAVRADDSLEWTTTRVLAAPEAHQAAAANESFVFAIASRTIAKYDRQTGKRIAVSRGEAEHLNSGFLLGDQLYCAHSNFPHTPEHSSLKVLDVKSMQLSTYKDFGNYGGSLTWAVLEGKSWWCNFARYGADNQQTFLVRFDDQWTELQRWTYPAEVLRHLGRMSLSGGVWWQGSLLVTDHDHFVLYQLELPDDGTVLRFVRTHRAPFSGQGIAVDPFTGGLVGIHRAQRQVIFAERRPPPSFQHRRE